MLNSYACSFFLFGLQLLRPFSKRKEKKYFQQILSADFYCNVEFVVIYLLNVCFTIKRNSGLYIIGCIILLHTNLGDYCAFGLLFTAFLVKSKYRTLYSKVFYKVK